MTGRTPKVAVATSLDEHHQSTTLFLRLMPMKLRNTGSDYAQCGDILCKYRFSLGYRSYLTCQVRRND